MRLTEVRRDGALAYLQAVLPPQNEPVCLTYKTRLGALLRVDGVAAGAFDREHHESVLPPSDRERTVTLEVELQALPTNGLPSGPGVIWRYLQAASRQRPSLTLGIRSNSVMRSSSKHALRQAQGPSIPQDDTAKQHDNAAQRDEVAYDDKVALIGHSHLDVAWLWTYEQTQRKAQRTFAIACDLLDRDPEFRFIQSQPQLYAFVEETDPQLFEQTRGHVAAGRFDPRVAALWVESDCNVPSGESILRQLLHGAAYCEEKFGIVPSVAWLPDTFGFMNTIPQLLAHAGVRFFSTTKLQWNDTTKFPYPQFVWRGPDGSSVVSALLQGYDGPAYPWRVATARKRNEPLAVGYGDGGGGCTGAMLDYARRSGEWIDIVQWFEQLAQRAHALPVHADELYLEYHRGVYTTHHDVKFHNALCERALGEAEELLAWCAAVHAPKATVRELQRRLDDAWRIVLRNQFHDVLPGTSIEPVYEDAADEYAAAEELAASVIGAAETMLPRATAARAEMRIAPREDGDDVVFENGMLRAHVRRNGTIVVLRGRHEGARNVCTQANVLALYRDKPKQWEAWNVDRGYERFMEAAKPQDAHLDDLGLTINFLLGRSPASMRIELYEAEPFLRVTLSVDWQERRKLLRVENWLALRTRTAVYGAPHGVIERSAAHETPEEKAKFEVPGQRFAFVRDGAGDGFAMFALDTYGWSARVLKQGGIKLGHSLLRGTCWPDPNADKGDHVFAYAFAPVYGVRTGALEHAWLRFAHELRVHLFQTDDPAVLVTACKPAQDGDGVIVRVRECEGNATQVRLRCGARLTSAAFADGLERPVAGGVQIQDEYLSFEAKPFGLYSLRVRFSHA